MPMGLRQDRGRRRERTREDYGRLTGVRADVREEIKTMTTHEIIEGNRKRPLRHE
jgi:hypothetical protein